MVIMSLPIELIIKESADYLKQLHKKAKRKGVSKIKMLMNIQSGIHHNHLLAIKSGASVRSINRWKATYQSQGLDGLLRDNRGGDFRSQLETADKERISQKLKDPKNGLRTYKEAQQWLKSELGIEKQYNTVRMYLKRNFGTKLKVGRKSHIKKDEAAVDTFKKTYQTR